MADKSSKKSGGLLKTGCIGCLLATVVLIAAVVIAGYFFGRDLAARGINIAMEKVLEETHLPAGEQAAVKAEFDLVLEDFKAGKLSAEDLSAIMSNFAESPLLPAAMTESAYYRYVEPSEMSEEEKADAKLQLQRYARGLYEKTIDDDDVQETFKPVLDIGGDLKSPEEVTQLQVEQMIQNVRAAVDTADVPNEPFKVDFAAEFRRIVDEARSGAEAPDDTNPGG